FKPFDIARSDAEPVVEMIAAHPDTRQRSSWIGARKLDEQAASLANEPNVEDAFAGLSKLQRDPVDAAAAAFVDAKGVVLENRHQFGGERREDAFDGSIGGVHEHRFPWIRRRFSRGGRIVQEKPRQDKPRARRAATAGDSGRRRKKFRS